MCITGVLIYSDALEESLPPPSDFKHIVHLTFCHRVTESVFEKLILGSGFVDRADPKPV